MCEGPRAERKSKMLAEPGRPEKQTVCQGRVSRAETEGLGSLRVYLQSFLKSNGISLKGVMQLNDIIRFLFSRGHSGKRVGKRPAWLWGGM